MNKRLYLKKNIETILINIELFIICFFCLTIESLGNEVYNKIAIIVMTIFVLIAIILCKYSRVIIEGK